MPASERSIVVVDAHPVLRASLAIALRHAGFTSVSSVHPDALDLEGERQPEGVERGDVILLGPLLGDGRTPLRLIKPLATRGYRVVVMTVGHGPPLVDDCFRLGAEAVLGADVTFELLVERLGTLVASGAVLTDEDRRAHLVRPEQHHATVDARVRPFTTLTTREAEVLTGLIAGIAPKQIAVSQGISVCTVRGHIQRVLRKLAVNSQREALAMARQSGWPSAPPSASPSLTAAPSPAT